MSEFPQKLINFALVDNVYVYSSLSLCGYINTDGYINTKCLMIVAEPFYMCFHFKVLEKCTKNLIGHSRLAFNNHESNIDC